MALNPRVQGYYRFGILSPRSYRDRTAGVGTGRETKQPKPSGSKSSNDTRLGL